VNRITHVVFESIHPRYEVVVPVDQAFAWWESQARLQRAQFDVIDILKGRLDDGVARSDAAKLSPAYYRARFDAERKDLQAKMSSFEVSQVIWDDDPKQRSFASGRFVWDFEHMIYHLAGIAVGAYGSVPADLHNPKTNVPASQHYVQHHWQSGINWNQRHPTYQKEHPLQTTELV
jgi:hypothetical protein